MQALRISTVERRSLIHRRDEYPEGYVKFGAVSPRGSASRAARNRWMTVGVFVFLGLVFFYARGSVAPSSSSSPTTYSTTASSSSPSNIQKEKSCVGRYMKESDDASLFVSCKLESAIATFQTFEGSQSRSVQEAKAAYTSRYQRGPPPGFEEWVEQALEMNAAVIDNYDQLHSDMAPFRHVSGSRLQEKVKSTLESARSGTMGLLSVRDGIVTLTGGLPRQVRSFYDTMKPALDSLPDVDILFNWLSQPRLLASSSSYESYTDEDMDNESDSEVIFRDGSRRPTWEKLRSTCKKRRTIGSFRKPRTKVVPDNVAFDVCSASEEVASHNGFFNAPERYHHTDALVPVLSKAKLGPFRDIAVPDLCYTYQSFREEDSSDNIPFTRKKKSLYWRGSSSGQYMQENSQDSLSSTYTSHRIRLLRYAKLLSDTAYRLQQNNKTTTTTSTDYHIDATKLGFTPSQLDNLSRLDPEVFDIHATRYRSCTAEVCEELEYELPRVSQDAFYKHFDYQFLFDTDNDSNSCRFYHLLATDSVVFKQTIWNEWHDERLVPWLHYIPISSGMEELPALLDYFINTDEGRQTAELVARAGREWSQVSLRKEDIMLYYYRLILEYASTAEEGGD